LRSKINAGPEEDGTGIANETATAQRTNPIQYHISILGLLSLQRHNKLEQNRLSKDKGLGITKLPTADLSIEKPMGTKDILLIFGTL